MPGLIGIVSNQNEKVNTEDLLSKMCQEIRHESWYKIDTHLNKKIGLGRVHLGILNPEQQPIFNEDKTLCILMDGEIYDYQDMKNELVIKGHTFSLNNDPEFILHLYEEYGIDFVQKLNGSFTLVIWNERSEDLLIINDRYGLRPLYYTLSNGYLLFGSEVKAILQDENFNRIVDDRSVADFFSFGYILGNKTFFQGIELLPPASIMTYNAGQISIKQYWNFNFCKESEKYPIEYYSQKFSKLLLQAVERQMKGNHRIGVPLSGGLDSRLIVASIDKKHYPLHTFTFGILNCDDARFAQMIANKLGTTHHFFEFRPEDIVSYASKEVYLMDGMLNCFHAHRMQTYGEISSHINVALSGFELLFNTYYINEIPSVSKIFNMYSDNEIFFQYFAHSRFVKDKNYTSSIKQLFSEQYYSQTKDFPSDSIENILDKSIKASPFEKIGYYNLKQRQRRFYLYGTVLPRHTIEVRTPLLDNDLMDFVFSLPPELRAEDKLISIKTIIDNFPKLVSISNTKTGMVITANNLQIRINNMISNAKHLINRITGKTIFENRKNYADYENWIKNNKELREYILNILLDEKTLKRPYFNQKYIKEILDLHMSGKKYNTELIGRLLTFELWNRQFIDK